MLEISLTRKLIFVGKKLLRTFCSFERQFELQWDAFQGVNSSKGNSLTQNLNMATAKNPFCDFVKTFKLEVIQWFYSKVLKKHSSIDDHRSKETSI